MATMLQASDAKTFPTEYAVTKAYMIVALVALFGGLVTGLFQGLDNAGIDLYPHLQPVVQSYYFDEVDG